MKRNCVAEESFMASTGLVLLCLLSLQSSEIENYFTEVAETLQLPS